MTIDREPVIVASTHQRRLLPSVFIASSIVFSDDARLPRPRYDHISSRLRNFAGDDAVLAQVWKIGSKTVTASNSANLSPGPQLAARQVYDWASTVRGIPVSTCSITAKTRNSDRFRFQIPRLSLTAS